MYLAELVSKLIQPNRSYFQTAEIISQKAENYSRSNNLAVLVSK